MKCEKVLKRLESMANPGELAKMKRFGINTENALGISVYTVRKLAREIGADHRLAGELWGTGIHEARTLAAFIDDPGKVTERQLESWVRDFDSWDVCDLVCSNLFDMTRFAYDKAVEWSSREGEFVKRAGFVLMAALSVHDKPADDKQFERFFPVIKREATDERNYVKKAVNWALRNIGKRNIRLNRKAVKTAREIHEIDSKAAGWIASDALRELTSQKIQDRVRRGRK
jgi:3-methyladenine DNA glycosylase AlkD